MMKNPFYKAEFHKINILLPLVLLGIATALPVLAQENPPALPPIPGLSPTISTNAPAIAALPPVAPESSDKPAVSASATPEIAPLMPVDAATAAPSITPPPMMTIPLPEITTSMPAPLAPPPSMAPATALPEVNVVSEKPKPKSWQTTLAPYSDPVDLHYNYRRTLMPSTIYRPAYNDVNTHLPHLVTRQDYDNLLFTSVSRNDVEAVRALLNAGANIDAVSTAGETPLALARRSGAEATAQLLAARGGH